MRTNPEKQFPSNQAVIVLVTMRISSIGVCNKVNFVFGHWDGVQLTRYHT